MAYLYENSYSSINEELEKKINDNLTNEKNRKIILSHSNLEELKTQIKGLEIDTNNPNAFHKINLSGYKGILIINTNSNITEEDIKLIKNSDYKYAILNTNNTDDIINKIMEIINENSNSEGNIITDKNSIKNTSVESIETDFNNSANVNLSVKKGNTELINEIETDESVILVKGNIYEEFNIINSIPIRVSLIDTNTLKRNSYITYNGQYEFKYPIYGGNFFIEFEINCGKYNGQNYELMMQEIKIDQSENIEQNTGKASNINNIKNNFKNITIKQEEEILKTENSTKISESSELTKLIIQTDIFEVQALDEIETLPDNTIPYYYGSIKIKERERFSLTVEKYVQNLKVTLADGSILVDYNSNSNNNESCITTTANKDQHIVTIDDELIHGATLEIIYGIKIKNNCNIDCSSYTLIDYLSYDNLSLLYDKNIGISEGKHNYDYWTQISSNDLKEYILNGKNLESDSRFNDAIYLKYEGKNLNKGEEQIIYLGVSKILTTSADSDLVFINEVELVQHSNTEGRKNHNLDGNHIRVGNYNIFTKRIDESDSSRVTVAVLPPFGNNECIIKYGLIIFSILLIILIIKKIKNKNN